MKRKGFVALAAIPVLAAYAAYADNTSSSHVTHTLPIHRPPFPPFSAPVITNQQLAGQLFTTCDVIVDGNTGKLVANRMGGLDWNNFRSFDRGYFDSFTHTAFFYLGVPYIVWCMNPLGLGFDNLFTADPYSWHLSTTKAGP